MHDIVDKFVDAIVVELDKEIDVLLPKTQFYEVEYSTKRTLKRW